MEMFDWKCLPFGYIKTDFNVRSRYKDGKWSQLEVSSSEYIDIHIAATGLHYGQEAFEGLKAYRSRSGKIRLFRPRKNWERFNTSAARLCMPAIDVEFQFKVVEALLGLDHEWVPHTMGSSLYIRPTMIATEAALGVHPSSEYLFFIVVGPVGAYYPQGFSPTKMYVSEEYVRAVRGGIGHVKAAGNYAASLYASRIATNMGYTQVLWLDSAEKKYS